MNVSEQMKATLEDALKLVWAGVKDETLITEFFDTEDKLPKGIILEDRKQAWKNLMVKRFVIMNEFFERFKNA